jgi:hypothetical protein
MQVRKFLPQDLPRLDQLGHSLVPNNPANVTQDSPLGGEAVFFANGLAIGASEARRIEASLCVNAVNAAVRQRLDLVCRAQAVCNHYFANFVAIRKDTMSQATSQALAPSEQPSLHALGCDERKPKNMIDPHRDTGDPGGHHPEQPSFRCIGMHHIGSNLTELPHETKESNEVPQRRDAAGHLDGMDGNTLLR